MIKHALKLIWNQKRKNAYMIVELFVLFIILFLAGYYIIDNISNYYQGVGCSLEDKYVIRLYRDTDIEKPKDKIDAFTNLKRVLCDLPDVKQVSLTLNGTPYSPSYSEFNIIVDSNSCHVQLRVADENFAEIFKPNIISGRWFTADDNDITEEVVIIDRIAEKTLFGEGSAVGKYVSNQSGYKSKVVGVIDFLKNHDYEIKRALIFVPTFKSNWLQSSETHIVFDLEKGTKPNPVEYQKALFSVLNSNDYQIIQSGTLIGRKIPYNSEDTANIKTTIFVTIFFIINIILGLLGILGYSVSQRRAEIGLRRAIGASAQQIRRLLFVEMQIVTLFAALPAILLVIQLPLFANMPIDTTLFFVSLATSVLFIMIIVSICVYYPAILASRIKPAIALKDE